MKIRTIGQDREITVITLCDETALIIVEGKCTAGDYSIWAALEKIALKTCNNGTVATLGPTSGLYFTPDGDTIYMYTRNGVKVEYTLSPEWKSPVVAQ